MNTRLGRHAAKVLAALRQLPWGKLGAELVLLHGSVLRSTRPRDIDLVVFLQPGVDVDEAALRIMEAVETATGLEADVYPVIDEAEADCFLILEAAKGGHRLSDAPREREASQGYQHMQRLHAIEA